MIIDQNKNTLKYLIKGISIVMLYFIISLYKNLPFVLLKISIEDIPEYAYNFYSIALEILIIVIIYYIYLEVIKLEFIIKI